MLTATGRLAILSDPDALMLTGDELAGLTEAELLHALSEAPRLAGRPHLPGMEE